jgi:plastocyanin
MFTLLGRFKLFLEKESNSIKQIRLLFVILIYIKIRTMKTKIILTLVTAVGLYGYLMAGTVTVTNSGNIFTPDEITVNKGDTVIFSLGYTHNAVEVSQSTWDDNDNTPNGGFSVGYGGGQVIMDTPGIYYYVCTPHAVYGMKGIINVTGTATSSEQGGNFSNNSKDMLNFYPNPVTDMMTLSFNVLVNSSISINLIDVTGQTVQNLVRGTYNAGSYNEYLNLSHLNPGRYFIVFESGYKNEVRPLLLAK